MKFLFGLAALVPMAMLLTAADPPVHADQAKVAKGGALSQGDGWKMSAARRAKAGEVEVHDKETDLMYFTEGDATMVIGGTMVGGKEVSPGQHRGTDITGGETIQVHPGDVVTVPPGVPHWFKETSGVSYILTKVIQP